ncbi:MAG TPA: reverse transcriptase domain-containing protein [Chthonomonadaceae bacterium]|nr:reverse transcriptase domain-containing protein [Chthonomonadaceae bacterium]
MRTAETVLSVIRERGQRKLPLFDLYRQLFNPDLYLRAYGRLYRNDGAMTQGATAETVDGMSLAKIDMILEDVRYERYRWTPARRAHIPKKSGKTRPLGLPSWSDKLLQEVIRSLLEAYFEPQFSEHSHGFRPERGCHTALVEIQRNWSGTKWFIEGDIRGCFDNIDHSVLLSILRQHIPDNRFLRLVENLLKAGYLEEWRYHPTLSGSPQGGVVSPVLSNIYLHQLDMFVERTLLPAYNHGKKRRANPYYGRMTYRASVLRKMGRHEAAAKIEQHRRHLSSGDPQDPDYRRLGYIRYADDWLLGFVGPKSEAEEIKAKIATFLRETLKLELSEEKTLITHATTQKARFLGYDVVVQHCDTKCVAKRRIINGVIGLRVPEAFVEERRRFYMKNGKPIHRMERTHEQDFTILARYQEEYRGYVQYYQLAVNLTWLNRLHHVMQSSLLKTLAHKHKSSVAKMARKYRAKVETPYGPRRCLETRVERPNKKALVGRFGGIPLRRVDKAIVKDCSLSRGFSKQSELVKRLLANECEACGSTENVEVHHIRKLADVDQKGRRTKPDWMYLMASRRRKTLVLCRVCHDNLHAGRPLRSKTE